MSWHESRTIVGIVMLGISLWPIPVEVQGTSVPLASAQTPPSENAARVRASISKAPSRVYEIKRIPQQEESRPEITSSVVATAVADSQVLKLGQVRIKTLSSMLEAQTRELVVANVPEVQSAQANGKPVAILTGAVELLTKDSQSLTLKALALANAPMRFNGQSRLYEGSISVGVVELMPSGRSLDLSAPITFEILGVTAKPSQPATEKTAPPFQTVAIEARNPSSAVAVRVRSILNPNEESVVSLPVERPRLHVSVSPETIQGWGLEKATISVWAEQVSGSGYVVQLQSRLGRAQPQTIMLDREARGTSEVRSVSIGKDQVTAEGPPFDSVKADVEYVMPIRFILAALLGGLVGGLPGSRHKRKVLESLIYGVIVFALFAVGVNVTGFALPEYAGEVLVFVVAALGALARPKLHSKSKRA